ncbi:MAG: hypothetical protein ACPGPF_04605, partial [Pontibacterium sp.]
PQNGLGQTQPKGEPVMDLIAFMSMVILAITILTLTFGVIAYAMYKMREKRKKKAAALTYRDVIEKHDGEYLFFER